MNGHGTEIERLHVTPNSYAAKPDKPIDSSNVYEFVDWYSDSELTVQFDFTSNPITDDITLYAKWRELP
jgi:uncharacterized repeat protein (TIGR02543 family)